MEIDKPSLANLFNDFYHPNPNINKKAFLGMASFWYSESSQILLNNLNHNDIEIRRKSVKALSYFGLGIVSPVSKLFFSTADDNLRVSCLKILVLLAQDIVPNNLPISLIDVINLSLESQNPQIILALTCLLRQLNNKGVFYLKILAKDTNLLKSKAAITALSEINESSIKEFLKQLSIDSSLDQLIRDSAIDGLRNFENRK